MKCQFTKSDKTQCKANAMAEVEYCFTHNPETKTKKEQAILRGGMAPKPRKDAKLLEPLSVKSVEGVLSLIEDTINRVRTEPITHQKANCIGYLANIALKALEVGDLEERLEELEKTIATIKTS